MSSAVIVAVQDSSGRTDTAASTSVTVAIGTNPSNGTMSGTATVVAVNGLATFSTLTISMAGTGYTLVASANGLTGATSAAFAVTAGPTGSLGFLAQPSAGIAGQMLGPAVQVAVRDTQGNIVTTATNAVTLAIGNNPSNGMLSGITTVAAISGVATFSTLSLNKTGTYTLNAYAASLRGATSAVFGIAVGSPTQLGFLIQPPVGGAGHVLSPAMQVAIQDLGGSTAPTATNNVSIALGTNPAGATLSGTTTVAAVNGVATFSALTVDKAGNGLTLVASGGGLTSATSTGFTIVPSSFLAISAGGGHACALAAGAAYCWGENIFGELGNGMTVDGDQCGTQFGSPACLSSIPALVTGGVTWNAVSANSNSTCAINTSGVLYCWGLLVAVGSSDEPVPLPVSSSPPLTFTAISVGGEYHACGIASAGAAYCWGGNNYGELGNGTTVGTNTPVAVSGGLTFTAISAGRRYTCGVVSNGAAYCWGYNTAGELGNSTTTNSTTPVAVSGGLTFTVVSAADYSSCGITTDGVLYCWGDNTYGQLGNGTTISSASPVAVSSSLTFTTVSAGDEYACAIATTGAAYCWGYNAGGELGNGTTTSSATPVAVSGGLKFATLSGSCGITLTGTAYCWGSNLGNGSTTGSTTPVPVF